MKLSPLLIVILALAQQQGLTAAPHGTATDGAGFDERLSALVIQSTPTMEQDVKVGKSLRVSGPLVRSFKGFRLGEAPRRFLHLINPFARTPSRQEMQSYSGLSAHAWTSIVGWSPGGSAFPDPATHESSMGLLSAGRW